MFLRGNRFYKECTCTELLHAPSVLKLQRLATAFPDANNAESSIKYLSTLKIKNKIYSEDKLHVLPVKPSFIYLFCRAERRIVYFQDEQ